LASRDQWSSLVRQAGKAPLRRTVTRDLRSLVRHLIDAIRVLLTCCRQRGFTVTARQAGALESTAKNAAVAG